MTEDQLVHEIGRRSVRARPALRESRRRTGPRDDRFDPAAACSGSEVVRSPSPFRICASPSLSSTRADPLLASARPSSVSHHSWAEMSWRQQWPCATFDSRVRHQEHPRERNRDRHHTRPGSDRPERSRDRHEARRRPRRCAHRSARGRAAHRSRRCSRSGGCTRNMWPRRARLEGRRPGIRRGPRVAPGTRRSRRGRRTACSQDRKRSSTTQEFAVSARRILECDGLLRDALPRKPVSRASRGEARSPDARRTANSVAGAKSSHASPRSASHAKNNGWRRRMGERPIRSSCTRGGASRRRVLLEASSPSGPTRTVSVVTFGRAALKWCARSTFRAMRSACAMSRSRCATPRFALRASALLFSAARSSRSRFTNPSGIRSNSTGSSAANGISRAVHSWRQVISRVATNVA